MPRVELTAPNGEYAQIMSVDPELIARWFAEQLQLRGAMFNPYEPWQLRIQPMFIPTPDGRGAPDWCPNQAHWAHHELTFTDQITGLIKALERIRDAK